MPTFVFRSNVTVVCPPHAFVHIYTFVCVCVLLCRWPVRADAGGVQQSAGSTRLAGPSHQTHTHFGHAKTLTQDSVCLSHSKSSFFLKNNSINQLISWSSSTLSLSPPLLPPQSSFPPSCPPTPSLLPDTQSLVQGAADTPTTLFPILHHLGQASAAAPCGAPWSLRVPLNPGASAAFALRLHCGPPLLSPTRRYCSRE